jgi:uncharacterized cupin superfamily protein
MPGMTHPNIYTDEFEYDPEDPPGYQGGMVHLTKAEGGSELAVKLFDLPAGEALCPFHFEFVEEWLLLVSGELELRTPAGTERLPTGAAVCFAAGPDGAHKVSNPGPEPARFVMFSSAHEPSVAVYPDSGKVGVWVPGSNFIFREADGKVPYYSGETD